MNCNSCRYEMSQCLDGRLPSGRRAVVMQHADSCEACAGFWSEFQAAQRLSLQLPREKVGEAFREQLWERIRAGEGTPDAVFREPVPTLVKARYALTGAAAAAAVLLFGLWLQDDASVDGDSGRSEENVAIVSNDPPKVLDAEPVVTVADDQFGRIPMIASARPLTADLVAVETARHIEARYDSVNLSLRQLGMQQRHAAGFDAQLIVDRILSDAGEMRVFAEVLLEMRDRERVSFRDPEVGADLRLVATMLEPRQLRQPNIEAVTTFVGRTVRQSPRLGRITTHIQVTPSFDPQEEAATLVQLNSRRPEVFRKLFIVIGQGDEISQEFGLFRQNHLFWYDDFCGANFVAPRSQLERLR